MTFIKVFGEYLGVKILNFFRNSCFKFEKPKKTYFFQSQSRKFHRLKPFFYFGILPLSVKVEFPHLSTLQQTHLCPFYRRRSAWCLRTFAQQFCFRPTRIRIDTIPIRSLQHGCHPNYTHSLLLIRHHIEWS